jgi:hypothetical protein
MRAKKFITEKKKPARPKTKPVARKRSSR